MTIPPFLLGSALLFWGWQTDMFVPGIVMAIVLEASRVVPWRVDLGTKAFSLLWRLCSFSFLGIAAYVYITERSMEPFVRGWGMQWSPAVFIPIVAAQAYSTSPRLDSAIFFYYMRTRPINLAYPYLFLVLLAATATQQRTLAFYIGIALLLSLTLWPARRKSTPIVLWLVLFAAAGALGYGGSLLLQSWQRDLIEMVVRFYRPERALERSVTSIGELGELKLSGAIVLRARPLSGQKGQVRLSRASYNTYRQGTWTASSAPLEHVAPLSDQTGQTVWMLRKEVPSGDYTELEVVTEFPSVKAILLTPPGTVSIQNFPVKDVSVSRMGAAMAEGASRIASYRLKYAEGQTLMGPPDRADLLIPALEEPALSRIITESGMTGRKGREVLDALSRFFDSKFRYSLELKITGMDVTPLADFLLRTRAGHCEYFASAATLLLRKAGIPARYTVGYFSEEYSTFGDVFIVRSRDAHAWVSVYIDGAWRTYDPTPASWVSSDRKTRSLFEPLRDLWSALILAVKRFNDGPSHNYLPYGLAIVLPVIGAVLWNMRKRLRTARKENLPGKKVPARPGLDSPFYRIEKALASEGMERHHGETHAEWLRRLKDARVPAGMITDDVFFALRIHERSRFDPSGISETERKELENLVERWADKRKSGL